MSAKALAISVMPSAKKFHELVPEAVDHLCIVCQNIEAMSPKWLNWNRVDANLGLEDGLEEDDALPWAPLFSSAPAANTFEAFRTIAIAEASLPIFLNEDGRAGGDPSNSAISAS